MIHDQVLENGLALALGDKETFVLAAVQKKQPTVLAVGSCLVLIRRVVIPVVR